MKRNITKLMAALALLVFMTPSMVMWGQTRASETITFAELGLENGVQYTDPFGTNISVTFGGGGNDGKYYTTGAGIRTYGGGTITITALGNTVTAISTTFSAAGYAPESDDVWTSNGTGTGTSGVNASWSGTATEVVMTRPSGSGHWRLQAITVTYSTGGPEIATPTFSPIAGLYTSSQSVTISCETEGTTIYYTIDGTTPDDESTEYTAPITVDQTMTIKAIAYDGDDNTSSVATAKYSILEHAGTETDPYSVADARAAIDANVGITGVYATGIVSEIVTAYNSTYGNITFDIVDALGNTATLRAYRCGGTEAANVAVNDIVVVYGDLTKYNSTYEFAQGCEVVTLTHPAVTVEAPTFNPVAGTYDEAQTVTISCETSNTTIYYTTDGSDPDDESDEYTGPITISTTTTIKAKAYDNNDNESTVATANYYFCSADDPYTVTEALAFAEYQYPANGIYVHGIVSTAPTQAPTNNGEMTYYISVDGEATNELEVYKGKGLQQAAFTAQDDIQVGDIVTIYGNVQVYNGTIEFASGNYLVSFERPQSTTPVINATTPETLAYDATEGAIAYTIDNPVAGTSLNATTNADWISNIVVGEAAVTFTTTVNEGSEDRTATFTLSYAGAEDATVTVTQGHYVVDYAELPFEWSSFGEIPAGITNNGVSTGSNNAYLKFDGSGDNIILKFNERPGTLEFYVKGNPGSNGWAGTFKVQTSVDGETYTDLQTYTELSTNEYQEESFANLDEDVRYIKWVYTEKVSGNVAVNYIRLAEYTGPVATITVDPATVDLAATGENGYQSEQLTLTYNNIEITNYQSFTVQFYDAEGTTQQQPNWLVVGVTGTNDDGYQVTCVAGDNEGEARTAYFKVMSGDVYSNLVTINQAGAPQQYTLTVEPFENLDLITFVNDEMVLEGVGEIQVTEGDEIMLSIVANEGYVMETLMVNGENHVDDIAEDYTYTFVMPAENVTISATAVEDVPVTPGTWVLTSLADLTEDDVFVIVGTDADDDTFALPYNGGTSAAPSATAITIVENAISGEPAAELQWNLSGNTTDGYTFYPNGETVTWLYCTNTNNGVRVGTNANKTFKMDEDGYLVNDATSRVLSIYVNNGTPQDWRCYSNYNNNPVAISFYKKVAEPVTETYTLDITGYEAGSDGGYYLIASPVTVNPANVEGMTDGEYDLYSFDQAEAEEWRNYKVNAFNLEPGKGYLYAKQATEPDEVFHFELTGTPYNGEPIRLSKSENVDFPGWNLVGNPFGQTAYIDRDFYVMKSDGSEIIESETNEIAVMQGVFVIADHDGEELVISTEAPANTDGKIVMNVSNGRRSVIDRAMVRFGEGRTLPKFMLNDGNTKIYIAEGNEEYAVVRSINESTTPVSFHAAENGTYTLSITAEDVDFTFFHLIDNLTGNDINLLSTPSYTFEASTTDYAQRFNLVYATIDGVGENNGEAFAFFNGNEWVVNNEGEANLQVIDVTGRLISSETVYGTATVSLNQPAGIYMLRLVNGDNVKVQKVVVR